MSLGRDGCGKFIVIYFKDGVIVWVGQQMGIGYVGAGGK